MNGDGGPAPFFTSEDGAGEAWRVPVTQRKSLHGNGWLNGGVGWCRWAAGMAADRRRSRLPKGRRLRGIWAVGRMSYMDWGGDGPSPASNGGAVPSPAQPWLLDELGCLSVALGRRGVATGGACSRWLVT